VPIWRGDPGGLSTDENPFNVKIVLSGDPNPLFKFVDHPLRNKQSEPANGEHRESSVVPPPPEPEATKPPASPPRDRYNRLGRDFRAPDPKAPLSHALADCVFAHPRERQ